MTGAGVVQNGRPQLIASPGPSVFSPRGLNHTVRAISVAPSRHLPIPTPGGSKGFLADRAAGQFSIPEKMPTIAATAGRQTLRFLDPSQE